MSYLQLTEDNIANEHICCAIADKKCTEGYELKKQWIANQLESEFVFSKLDERAKVFIEYGPAENAWLPVKALNFLALGCFWVSGRFKGSGHGKALLKQAVDRAIEQGRDGIIAVTGAKKKFHFMSDGKWLKKQGFIECDTTLSGFSLLMLPVSDAAKAGRVTPPAFTEKAKIGECDNKSGFTVYYSNRCPFTEFHIKTSLAESAEKRGLDINVVKLASRDDAFNAPSPGTIFSLFKDGKFITTDVSVCMDSRFDKITGAM